MLQILEYNAHGVDPLKLDKQQLVGFLRGKIFTSLESLHVEG